jgi:hypothetical protein
LVIQPGQDVRISGDPGLIVAPSWGSGGFTVQGMGTLLASNVVVVGGLTVQGGGSATVSGVSSLSGEISVQSGGAMHLSYVSFIGQTYDVLLADGSEFTRQGGTNPFDAQCDQPYTTLDDAWRSTSTGLGSHRDCAGRTAYGPGTGVGGGGWYRFMGSGGDALVLTPPGGEHCGTDYAGWLSGYSGEAGTTTHTGCDGNTGPSCHYSVPGRYPHTAEGVVEMTACFHNGQQCAQGAECDQCWFNAPVGVVHCGGFLLWRLSYAQSASQQASAAAHAGIAGYSLDCNAGYCTAPSGL